MRILHTSDWHLGRTYNQASLLEDQHHVLQQFLALATELEPDVVVIAGDLYDRAVPPGEAVELFDEVLCKLLLELELPTLAIAGNHDSPERVGFASRVLSQRGLHLFGAVQQGRVVTLDDAHGKVDFVGVPYAQPEDVRSTLAQDDVRGHEAALAAQLRHAAPSVDASRRRVAIAHAFVTSALASDSERPLTVGGTGAVDAAVFDGFHYTALGHLHRPQSLREGRLRYSGSLLQYSFAEADHRKSVSLVTLDQAGGVTIEPHELSPRHPMRVIEGSFDELCARANGDPAREDYLLIRLLDRTPILDAMPRLRKHYPNALELNRPLFDAAVGGADAERRDHRKMRAEDVFAAFFHDVTGESLIDAERAEVLEALAATEAEHQELP